MQSRQRYAHVYRGSKGCGRGLRFMSKLHKGLQSGDVNKAFEEISKVKEQTVEKVILTKHEKDVILYRNYKREE